MNVLSDFALVGFPGKSAYCSSKFAVRGLSESLQAELHGSSVGLTCVYPGAVDTNLVRSGRAADERKRELEAEFLARRAISPQAVGERIVRAIETCSPRVLIGWDALVTDLAKRLFPNWSAAAVAHLSRHLKFV